MPAYWVARSRIIDLSLILIAPPSLGLLPTAVNASGKVAPVTQVTPSVRLPARALRGESSARPFNQRSGARYSLCLDALVIDLSSARRLRLEHEADPLPVLKNLRRVLAPSSRRQIAAR
jgi:hypothetical protein